MKIGAAATGALPVSPTSPADGAKFSQALSQAASAPAAGTNGTASDPLREVQGAAARSASGNGLGDRILNGIESMYRSDQALKRPSSPAVHVPGASLRTAALAPGPAAAPVGARVSSERASPAAGMPDSGDFGAMLQSLEQVYAHAIQVSVVTKTTGSFTSSLNKLMSSG
jgi:hypothetical protein